MALTVPYPWSGEVLLRVKYTIIYERETFRVPNLMHVPPPLTFLVIFGSERDGDVGRGCEETIDRLRLLTFLSVCLGPNPWGLKSPCTESPRSLEEPLPPDSDHVRSN